MTKRDTRFVDGYVADTLYPSMFHHRFTPAWIDSFLVRNRIPPPRKSRGPFVLVDAGCGDGFGLIANAAAHPEAQFIGFDASAKHIARGRKLIRTLKLPNVRLERATLQSVSLRTKADYITAQGLLSWISRENQQVLWKFARKTLKPAGAFAVGYNALPGWASMIPCQRLLRAFADHERGNSEQRFASALERVRTTGIIPQSAFELIDKERQGQWRGYVPHEYLNQYWDPLWSGDVLQAAEATGLQYAATLMEQRVRDEFAFTKAQRAVLADISHNRERETAADLFRNTWFRIDLFVRPGYRALRAASVRRYRMQQYWAAQRAQNDIEYSFPGAAGRLRFDNRAARSILAGLESGPNTLQSVRDISAADLLNTIDALFHAGLVRPVNPPAEIPAALFSNAAFSTQGSRFNGVVGTFGAVSTWDGVAQLNAEARVRLGIPALKE